MDKVQCLCTSCRSKLGVFVNLWSQIGKGHLSPVVGGEDCDNLVALGAERDGEQGTLVANCVLQDVACATCNKDVGLKCLTSPVNHVLRNGQILLRRASVRMTAGRGSGTKDVELNIHRVLKLKVDGAKASQGPSSPSTPAGVGNRSSHDGGGHAVTNSVAFDRMQNELDLQRDDIDRIDSAAYQVVSSFDSAVSRIDREMARLDGTMRDLRRDLDNNSEALAPLETGLEEKISRAAEDTKSIVGSLKSRLGAIAHEANAACERANQAKTCADTLRTDLQAARRDTRTLQGEVTTLKREVVAAKKESSSAASSALAAASAAAKEEQQRQAKEIEALRSEMRHMRDALRQQALEQEKLAQRRPDPPPASVTTSSHSPRELEILSTNITRLATRTNQVDSLEMKFDLFEPRMSRLEGRMDSVEAGAGAAAPTQHNDTEGVSYHTGSEQYDNNNKNKNNNHHTRQAQPFQFIQGGAQRKRQRQAADAGVMDWGNIFTPSKRPAYSPVDSGHGTGSIGSSPPESSGPACSRRAKNSTLPTSSVMSPEGGRRLTKAGTVDQRYTKKKTARRSRAGNDLDSIYAPPEESE